MKPKRRPPARKPAAAPGPVLPGRLLCIDLGSRLIGWATADLDGAGTVAGRDSGSVDLEALAGPRRWARVDVFARWLTVQLDRGVTWFAVEEPFTQRDNVGTRHLLHGLFAFAQVIAWRRFGQDARAISRIDVFRATVGWCLRPVDLDAPKPAKGQGRRKMRAPTKAEIRDAVNARHGSAVVSEDEADAVAMLDLVLAELAGTGMSISSAAREAAKIDTLAPHRADPAIAALAEANARAAAEPVPPARAQLEAATRRLEDLPTRLQSRLERELAAAGIGGAPVKVHAKGEARAARGGSPLQRMLNGGARPVRGRKRGKP